MTWVDLNIVVYYICEPFFCFVLLWYYYYYLIVSTTL